MKPLNHFILALIVLSSFPTAGAAGTSMEWPDDILRLVPESVEIQRLGDVGSDGLTGYPVNVLQDCWTNDDTADLELETYKFLPGGTINYVWKHKIFERPCLTYLATIVITNCQPGKPRISGNIVAIIPDIRIGEIEPGGEWLILVTAAGLNPGRYDWFVVVECNDSNGSIPIGADGDIDDVEGANLGLPPNNPLGPVVHGPEPIEVLDPAPGGYPPGRQAGDEGSTRCWCFEVN